jgi:tripartite-type tricarboxylate transporter receptor subunit TctC
LEEAIMTNQRTRRVLIGALLVAAAAWAQAEDYPKGPITVIVPLAPGDAVDIAARAIGEELSKSLKVPVLVVNRPGAGGALGADNVVKANKDGYTIGFIMNAALTFRRVLDPQTATYDPMKDITPLGLAMRTPSIVAVRSDLPYRNFSELVVYARANPGQVRIGTPGAGSAGEFAVATINSIAGTDIAAVPFKGASPAITAMRGAHVEGVALALGVLSGHLKSGSMRGIVASSSFPDFPDIPTLAALGHAQKLLGVWAAFIAPAGVPAEVTGVLVPAIEKAVKTPAVAARLHALGMVEDYQPPEKLLDEIRDEYRMVEEIARKAGFIK